MLEIYADGALIYDSRVPEAALLELKVTKALNKGGTATITVPPWHAAYNAMRSYRTLVEIYRDGHLIFRGRPLYPADTFDAIRTFTCEGERCFMQDGVLRGPYIYQDAPGDIFRDVVRQYNEQVDEFKRFEVGTVDVTDANDYILLENGEAEPISAVLDKLVERCGGYITFTDTEDGKRAIHWRAQLTRRSTQDIAFGDNLLDFTRTTANTELATVIVPYGAVKDENTGERYTIQDVNGGADYITAPDDVLALRGWIWKAVTWDDVTEPANLLTKAREYLADSQQMLTTLTLTALDLSVVDKTVDNFELGDIIKVHSRPHGIDGETYQLTEMTLDLLNPQNDTITLGKTVASLTGADVVTTMQASNRLNKVSGTARAAYTVNAAAIAQLEQTFRSEIEQLPDRISLSVSGSLGGTASIALSVGGVTGTPATLDLSGVRQAFASDTSAVTISAGTITFNSGSIIINSSKCQLTAAGKLTVEDAVVKGDITTIEGSFKTEMSKGSLRLYYTKNGTEGLCGTINTKYYSGASTEGISLRIESKGSYIMFSHPDSSQGTGYAVDYYLNYGWSSNYSEKHIFQTSARFLSDVYLDGKTDVGSLRLRGAGGKRYLITANDNGTVTCSVL